MSKSKKINVEEFIKNEICPRVEKYPDLPEDEFIPIEYDLNNENYKKINSDSNYIYLINKKGEIKNKNNEIINLCVKKGHGYLLCKLYISKNKSLLVRVHILVASTFLINKDKNKFNIVNHIDNNRSNNNLSNLEFTTLIGNCSEAAGKKSPMSSDKRVVYVGIDELGKEIYRFTSLSIPDNICLKSIDYSIKNNTKYRNVIWHKENTRTREESLYKLIGYSGNLNDYKWYKHPFYNVQICKEGYVRYQYVKNHKNHDEVIGSVKDGYIRIDIKDNGETKKILVHRLIMEFILKRHLKEGEEVDHINNIKYDNSFDNLRLVNRIENMKNELTRNKLSKPTMVINIFGDLIENNISRIDAYRTIFGRDSDIVNMTGREIKYELFSSKRILNKKYLCLKDITLDCLINRINCLYYVLDKDDKIIEVLDWKDLKDDSILINFKPINGYRILKGMEAKDILLASGHLTALKEFQNNQTENKRTNN